MLKSIIANIIQELALWLTSFIVNAGNLKATTIGNQMCKFVDDTWVHSSLRLTRLRHRHGLTIWHCTMQNQKKSYPPMRSGSVKRHHLSQFLELFEPHQSKLSASPSLKECQYKTTFVTSSPAACRIYGSWVAWANCLGIAALQTMYRSIVVTKLMYTSTAWWGFINVTDQQRVNAFLHRSIQCGYRSPGWSTFWRTMWNSWPTCLR
jgi:hypothetical protein